MQKEEEEQGWLGGKGVNPLICVLGNGPRELPGAPIIGLGI
jgi:hypothetical protein